jgi:hypothetical protein
MTIKGSFFHLYSQVKGFKTHRKLVVIESDDWGSTRMPRKEVLPFLAKSGINLENNPHSRFDTLEDENDLAALFELLHKPIFNNNKPKITCNFIMANPDFNKIEEDEFNTYHYKVFTESYFERDGNNKVWELMQEGIDKSFFVPQFHGREHIQFHAWLSQLKQGNKLLHAAFKYNCYAIDLPNLSGNKSNLMAAFDYENASDLNQIEESIADGLSLFEQVFKFKSRTAIAPRYVWDNAIEMAFKQQGIDFIQSAVNQKVPFNKSYLNRYHYTGELNQHGQYYMVRNAYFEPAYNQQVDWIAQVLRKAKLAFLFRTPLIISMHRINFCGGLVEENRNKNLKLLEQLLKKLIEKYPEVEFISSDELGHLIELENVRN